MSGPTYSAEEVTEAKRQISSLMPVCQLRWRGLRDALAELVISGAVISPEEWAKVAPSVLRDYETLKAIHYAAETAKGADE